MNFFKHRLTLLSLLVMLTLTGCNSLDDAVQRAKAVIPGDWKVLHAQQVKEESAVVFYVKDYELGAGLFEKDAFDWKWNGSSLGTLVTYPEGLSWRYSDLSSKSKKYYLYYGIVKNPEITAVEVKTTWGESSKANIIEKDGCRLWYAFISKAQVPSVDADIMGYSQKGDLLYLFSQPKQGSNK